MSSLASSSKRSAPCSLCGQPSKYTCPRCAAQTCSLPCSRSHKATTGCSGIRDPARYVAMNEFGYGKLMDDYVYLEQGRRKVDGWNKGLDDGKKAVVGKREGLRNELRKRGCVVDFLPEGMERRTQNSSSWNPKTQTLQLTIQLVLPDSTSHVIPRTILTASASSTVPATPSSLLAIKQCKTIESPSNLVFAIAFYQPLHNASPSSPTNAVRYFKPLDPNQPIVDQLNGLAFLEFPTLHLIPREEWEGKLASGQIVVMNPTAAQLAAPESARKQQDQARDSGWGARGIKRPAVAESAPASEPKRPALVDYASDSDNDEEQVEMGVADDLPGELVIDERVLDALVADQAVRG